MPEMSKFPVCLPRELHRTFKMKCARDGRLMAEVVREMVQRACEADAKTETVKSAKANEPAPGSDRRVTKRLVAWGDEPRGFVRLGFPDKT